MDLPKIDENAVIRGFQGEVERRSLESWYGNKQELMLYSGSLDNIKAP